LKVVAVSGGPPVIVADVTNPLGGVWTANETIVFAPSNGSGLWQVSPDGGALRSLMQPDSAKGERGYRWPEVLPGGEVVLFTVATSDIVTFDNARLVARSLRTGEQHDVLRGGTFPTFAATGHLLYVRAGALLAAPFDAKHQQLTGPSRTVIDGVMTYPNANGAAQYALAENGTLLYVAGGPSGRQRTLSWADRTGKATPLQVDPAQYLGVTISPDGRQAALNIDGANAHIFLMDLDRGVSSRLTLEWNHGGAYWSNDGSHVTFASMRRGTRMLYRQRVDGRGDAEPIFATGAFDSDVYRTSWSPDGR